MRGSSANRSQRNRALAELARARGWVEDAALDGAAAAADTSGSDLGESLVRAGLLGPEQLRSLREVLEEPTVAPDGDRT
ncbi:MAG: hypothetical protein FD180_2038, partial [Planctomycetota bacterium]